MGKGQQGNITLEVTMNDKPQQQSSENKSWVDDWI
jgi:hypothetical protein